MLLESDTGARCAQMVDKEQDDLYVRFKTLQRQLEFIEIQVSHTSSTLLLPGVHEHVHLNFAKL